MTRVKVARMLRPKTLPKIISGASKEFLKYVSKFNSVLNDVLSTNNSVLFVIKQ